MPVLGPSLPFSGGPFYLAGRYGPEAMLDGLGQLLKNMEVFVYEPGTTTPATVWADKHKVGVLTNPVTTTPIGDLIFYAEPGDYDIALDIGGVAQPTLTVTVEPDPTELVSGGSTVEDVWTLTIPGALTVSTGHIRMYSESTWTITGVRASVGTAPTGSSIIVDVLKNGTTTFGTHPGNRPTIAAGTNMGLSAAPDTASLVEGDYVTINVTQVGSTVAGSDLTVNVKVHV